MNKPYLEEQYRLYLERVGLDESKMPETQRIETKRAFMGACGQLLMLFTNELIEMPDNKSVVILDDMIQETKQFWLSQMNKN